MTLPKDILPKILGLEAPIGVDMPPASTAPRPRLKQGIYILPTVITLANMGLGFFAMVKTLAGEFSTAATAIIVGHLMDVLDGRVARWTGTDSKFGIELDSLSDLVSFCVAPAFLMYEMVLQHNSLWGFPVALLFVICGALRLTRFNLKAQAGEAKGSHFVGLPTPAAGGLLAIFALLYDMLEVGKPVRSIDFVMNRLPLFYEFVPAIMLVLSLLMVSEVPFSSLKNINLLRPRSMRALILTLLIILMAYVYPQNMLFIFYMSYIVWGLTNYFLRLPKPKAALRAAEESRDNYGK